jgi:hypothetical protein
MRVAVTVSVMVGLGAAVLLGGAVSASAQGAGQLSTAQLRPLVLTTAGARHATGFVGTMRPGTPVEFKCGRQPDNHAQFCSHIWDSPSEFAHPTISTVASFATAKAAQAQIRAEAARAKQAGTIVSNSKSQLVYFVSNLPGVGTAAIAQQALGSTYAYAWCSSASTEPTGPAVQCARDLLAAQATRARAG